MMYKLISENLTSLGHQGSSSTVNWTRYFDGFAKAKRAAEKDYGSKIEWEHLDNYTTSGDLNYVMYDIRSIKVE